MIISLKQKSRLLRFEGSRWSVTEKSLACAPHWDAICRHTAQAYVNLALGRDFTEVNYFVHLIGLFDKGKFRLLYKLICIWAFVAAVQFQTWSEETSNSVQIRRLIYFKHKLKLGLKFFTNQPNDEYIFPVRKLNVKWKCVPKFQHIKMQLGACSKLYTWNSKQRPVNRLP